MDLIPQFFSWNVPMIPPYWETVYRQFNVFWIVWRLKHPNAVCAFHPQCPRHFRKTGRTPCLHSFFEVGSWSHSTTLVTPEAWVQLVDVWEGWGHIKDYEFKAGFCETAKWAAPTLDPDFLLDKSLQCLGLQYLELPELRRISILDHWLLWSIARVYCEQWRHPSSCEGC